MATADPNDPVRSEQSQEAYEQAILDTRQHEINMENLRASNNLKVAKAQADASIAVATAQHKLEAVRLAKETLIENRRTQPAATAADITAADITAFASVLESHLNS